VSTYDPAVTSFTELLSVSPAGDDVFHARPPGEGFLFGGLTMALALRAAAMTVPDALVAKSLHCTFLRAGRWGTQLELPVARVSDTRSFANRRVEVIDAGQVLAVAHLSFHRPEPGTDWHARFDPGAGPEEATPVFTYMGPSSPAEVRVVRADGASSEGTSSEGTIPEDTIHPYWSRPVDPCPPELVANAVVFVSDYFVINTPFPTSGSGAGMVSRTLEHAIWFHRPAPDGWLRYDAEPVSVTGGRFVSKGAVHDTDGTRIATFVQEGVVRPQRVPG
jgi:acyl-CoA thioesterase II